MLLRLHFDNFTQTLRSTLRVACIIWICVTVISPRLKWQQKSVLQKQALLTTWQLAGQRAGF